MKEGKTEAPTYFFTDDIRMKGGSINKNGKIK